LRTVCVITIGSKGAQFARRLSEVDLTAVYPPFADQPSANEVRPILNTVLEKYAEGVVDEVQLIYTKFISTVSQNAMSQQLLPAPAPDSDENVKAISNFEPDADIVVEQVTTRLIEAQIWQAVLESLASEHAMRMLATKNATDNANELIKDYTLELNTARQAAITQELAEISGGAEALNG
jgi:F-type H+-transporting ATPase subunit gamma